MPIIVTPGASDANSYLTVAEAQAYFDTRLPIAGWDTADDQELLLIMATRVLDMMTQGGSVFVPAGGGMAAHYRVQPHWTGSPSTTTQRLSWPRTGMYTRNGLLIESGELPLDLKYATAELAGQLTLGDRTLDNDVITQGLKSLSAGPVSLSFKDTILPQVLPDAVYNLMPASWLTQEEITYIQSAEFEVL